MTGIVFENVSGNKADITLYQGKTINFAYVWGGETPINVTGFSARLTVKESFTDATPAADFTVANSRVAIGGADGVITFTMTAADSAELSTPFNGVYEIEVTTASGVVHKGLYGKCTIIPEVCT